MLINDHFHSICSFDAEFSLWEMCAAAKNAGVTELCLTDHCDLIDEWGKPCDSFSWEAEDRQLREAREKTGLTVRRGIELGQAILRPEAAERVLREPGIDFVLGSMHNTLEGQDFYYMDLSSREDCDRYAEEYLQALLKLSETDWFDSLAHLSYPLRYMRKYQGESYDLHGFDDLIYEILKRLVERGKALELNVSGYRNNFGEPMAAPYMLKMYRQLGGDLITIGTDAHEPRHMAEGLEEGMALLKSCGFRYVTRYKDRKPEQYLL